MKYDRAMGDAGATFQARKDNFQDYVKPSIFPSIRNLQKTAKSYTDFLVRIRSKYNPWDSTTQANPSAEYEALHSKRVTLNYLDVLNYIEAWESISTKAIEAGYTPENAGQFMASLLYAVAVDVYKKFDIQEPNKLYGILDAQPYIDYIRGLCNIAANRACIDKSDCKTVLLYPSDGRVKVSSRSSKKDERREGPRRLAMTSSGKTMHPRAADYPQPGESATPSTDTHSSQATSADEEPVAVSDLAEKFGELKIHVDRHSGNSKDLESELRSELQKTRKEFAAKLKKLDFEDSGATLPKASTTTSTGKSTGGKGCKPQTKQVTILIHSPKAGPARDLESDSEDFSQASYSKLSDYGPFGSIDCIDTMHISTFRSDYGVHPASGEPDTPPASDEAIRCRYCWNVGHRMVSCDFIAWSHATSSHAMPGLAFA